MELSLLMRRSNFKSAVLATSTDRNRCLAKQEIAAVKEDAERDLAMAQPALDAALGALNSISSKDINSLKALKSPPDIVKRIFDCVLLLRQAIHMYTMTPAMRSTLIVLKFQYTPSQAQGCSSGWLEFCEGAHGPEWEL